MAVTASSFWRELNTPSGLPVSTEDSIPDSFEKLGRSRALTAAGQHKEATALIKKAIEAQRKEEQAVLEAREHNLTAQTGSPGLTSVLQSLRCTLPHQQGVVPPEHSLTAVIPDGTASPLKKACNKSHFKQPTYTESLTGDLSQDRLKKPKGNDLVPYHHMGEHLQHALHDVCDAYLSSHPSDRVFTEARIAQINAIIHICMEESTVISEQTYAWILSYALRSTAPADVELTAEDRNYIWTYSMGGDKEPPPYVELFLFRLLEKRKLLAQQALRFLPDIHIVHVMFCQLQENTHAHDGTPMDASAHIQSCYATLSRLRSFTERFYPEHNNSLFMHMFPAYHQESALYAETLRGLQASGLRLEDLEKLTGTIRGKVSSEAPMTGAGSGFTTSNPYEPYMYAAMHAWHSLLCSSAHTLRFASKTTETNLQAVAACVASRPLLRAPTLHGHVGWDLPGPYYKQNYDPTLKDLIASEGVLSMTAPKGRDGTSVGAEKIRALGMKYGEMVATVGRARFVDHLRSSETLYTEPAMEAGSLCCDKTTTHLLLGLPHA
jgi:hypothetical protein